MLRLRIQSNRLLVKTRKIVKKIVTINNLKNYKIILVKKI
jgi:hypothetical protein